MEYNTALCDFLRLPLDPCTQNFLNVTTQVYPLRADQEKLNTFCDEYLNVGAPSEAFEAAGPWVIMQVVDYGKIDFDRMVIGPGQRRFANKWFSQHEVAFGIPLRCTKGKRGAFTEFAVVYPFIFVDSPLSMEGGRQIYGWPKAGMTILPTPPEFQPSQPGTSLRVEANPFMLDLHTQRSLPAPVVEITQSRPFLSGRSGIADALTWLPRAMSGYFSLTSSFFESMSNVADFAARYKIPTTTKDLLTTARDLQSLGETIQNVFSYYNSAIPMLAGVITGQESRAAAANPKVTIYTMKQVRDAEDTSQACYQAIVRSEMTVDQVKDGGFLFDPMSADPSGGIEITLDARGNDYLAGLMRVVLPSATEESGQVFRIRPLVPFWGKVDLSYGLAERHSWRTKETDWQQQPNTSSPAVVRAKQNIEYQRRGTGSALEVAGRRSAHNTTLHVFKLNASMLGLRDLVQNYLNRLTSANVQARQRHFEFRVRENFPYVYVTLLDYDSMTINGRGHYGDTLLTFAVLVDYWQVDANGHDGPQPAFIPLYTFVGTDWNFVTEYEVYGRLAFRSILESPRETWLSQAVPGDQYREVLSVSTTLFPRVRRPENMRAGEPNEARLEKIIGVLASPSGRRTPYDLGSDAEARLARECLRENGLDNYFTMRRNAGGGGARTAEAIALKQVRSAIRGAEADYQSLVAVRRTYTIDTFVESSVRLRIYERDGLPLVDRLALQGARPDRDRAGNFKEFDADALNFTGTLEEDQGRELWRRVAPHELWVRWVDRSW